MRFGQGRQLSKGEFFVSIGDPKPLLRPVPPGLHLLATPIGAARDITLRALDLLAGADVLAAEDTRTLRHLMEIHGVALNDRPLVAYHDHNGAAVRPRLLRALPRGVVPPPKFVAVASGAARA
jgi:16S rRNA C1402 (ribose-2'-O) methylase RsmI